MEIFDGASSLTLGANVFPEFISLNCRFFKQYLILLCTNQMASGLFRLMAALGRNIIVANTVGSFALLVVLVLGGFVISRGEFGIYKRVLFYFFIC